MRRDLRFEREALQQPLAEAVDGVDLEAAFGFERASEETPRRRSLRIRRGTAMSFGEFLAARPRSECVAQAASSRKQPVLHLGRRGLGVGQAQDAIPV